MASHYEILGLTPNATEEEIRSAYKALAKRWHPDKNQSDPSAEEKFKLINAAYTTLSDKTKRAFYDLSLFTTAFEEVVQQTPQSRRAPSSQSTRRRPPPINRDSIPKVQYYFSFKTKLFTWFFVLMLIPGFIGIIVGWSHISAIKYKSEAKDLLIRKDYRGAANKFGKALDLPLFKKDGEAAWYSGFIFSEHLDDPYAAVNLLVFALNHNYPLEEDTKNRAITYRLIAKNLLFQNKTNSAWDMISIAEKADPDLPLNFEYGAYFDLVERLEEAEKYYKLALQDTTELDLTQLRLAKLLFQQERFIEAQFYFEQLILKFEDSAELYYYQGLCQINIGELEKGCQTLKLAVELRHPTARYSIIEFCN